MTIARRTEKCVYAAMLIIVKDNHFLTSSLSILQLFGLYSVINLLLAATKPESIRYFRGPAIRQIV